MCAASKKTERAAGEADSFAEQAESDAPGLLREFWDFLCNNKKWWLVPILVVLLLFAALAIMTPSGVTPFIYAIF